MCTMRILFYPDRYVVGVGLGTILHQYIIHTIRVDMVMFGQHVSLISFLISAVLTAVFSAFVNFVMYFKLKEIDMVESLRECGIGELQKNAPQGSESFLIS